MGRGKLHSSHGATLVVVVAIASILAGGGLVAATVTGSSLTGATARAEEHPEIKTHTMHRSRRYHPTTMAPAPPTTMVDRSP